LRKGPIKEKPGLGRYARDEGCAGKIWGPAQIQNALLAATVFGPASHLIDCDTCLLRQWFADALLPNPAQVGREDKRQVTWQKRKHSRAYLKKSKSIEGGGHHGGGWKVAYADFNEPR